MDTKITSRQNEEQKEKRMRNGTGMAALVVILGGICVIAMALGVSYLIVSLLWWLICLGLGIEFNWFAALGIFAVCMLLRWVVSAAKPK